MKWEVYVLVKKKRKKLSKERDNLNSSRHLSTIDKYVHFSSAQGIVSMLYAQEVVTHFI